MHEWENDSGQIFLKQSVSENELKNDIKKEPKSSPEMISETETISQIIMPRFRNKKGPESLTAFRAFFFFTAPG